MSLEREFGDSDPKIALALFGGGARAMAFHLGCLRALHELGILGRVRILSTVSGGSVIGALYASSDDPFPVFEAQCKGHTCPGTCAAGNTHRVPHNGRSQSLSVFCSYWGHEHFIRGAYVGSEAYRARFAYWMGAGATG